MRDHQSVVKNNNTSQVLSVMDDLLQGNAHVNTTPRSHDLEKVK